MLWTDLHEVKAMFDIPDGDTSENKKLLLFCTTASDWIEELLGRKGNFGYKTRTQFYRGSGTQRLLLRSRPVFPNPLPPYAPLSVLVDEGAAFGTASGAFTQADAQLTYGTDYTLQIDQDDGSSRCGILIRLNQLWPKPMVRQAGYLSPFVVADPGSISVTYTAGYKIDTLPAQLRFAADTLVAKMRYFMPLGFELGSDGYEDRTISILAEKKNYLLSTVFDLILPYQNRRW